MVEIVDVQQHHDQLRAQIASIWGKIMALTNNHTTRKDLVKLHENTRIIWAKLDNEMIECRKRGRATANYKAMASDIAMYLKIMDKEIFWQKLH